MAPSLSPFKPKFYPLFFVLADVSCLVIQAIGGGIAASAGKENYKLLQHGNRVIIAGIVLQVVVLGAFGILSTLFILRVRKNFRSSPAHEETPAKQTWTAKKTKMYLWAMTGAYACLLIRCIYRIAEMAGGWGNKIMQDEWSFVALESFMVLIASVLFTAFAPGWWFPWMSRSGRVNPGLRAGRTDREGGVEGGQGVGEEMGETGSEGKEKVVGV